MNDLDFFNPFGFEAPPPISILDDLFGPGFGFSGMPEQITNDGNEDILQVDESAEDDDIPEMEEEDD